MLSDYDEFVGLLRHNGDIASGVALVEPSNSSSLVGSSSVRSVFATTLVVTQGEALQTCGTIGLTSSLHAGGGASGGNASSLLPQSFPPYTAGTADASASTQRDTLLFIVGDGGSTNAGKQLPWFVGFVSEATLRSESTDVPMSVLVPALFGTIRTTMSSSSSSSTSGASGGLGSSGGMLLTIDTTPPLPPPPHNGAVSGLPTTPPATTAPVLLIDIRGSIRKQFCIHLVKLDVGSERRRSAHSLLTRVLLSGHTTAMLLLERERRARAEAEEALSRAHALLLEHGGEAAAATIGNAGRGGPGNKDGTVRAKLTRPTSIINPQQKGPTKRPRGVKLN